MLQRLRAVAVIVPFLMGISTGVAEADSFAEGLRFELDMARGGVSPSEYNEILGRLGLEEIDRLWGVNFGVAQDLRWNLDAAFRVGYLVGSTNVGEIFVGSPFPRVPSGFEFETTTVPLSIGAEYRIEGESAALIIGISGEINFVTLTMRIFENKAAGVTGFERDTDTTLLSLNTTLGAEWTVMTKFAWGFRGGYRLSETGDVAFPGDPRIQVPFDVSGAYASVFIAVRPWAKPMKNDA